MRNTTSLPSTCVIAVLLCALGGCNSMRVPRIDPSGQRIFLPPEAVPQGVPTLAAPPANAYGPAPAAPPANVYAPAQPLLGGNGPKWKHDRAVTIAPRTIVSPVGREVVLTATVCGYEGFMMAGERVEWTVGQGGVGEIVALGQRETLFDKSKKVNGHYAIGTTSRRDSVLDRGTDNPADDVSVLKGQSWVSVVSAREGVSHVTAYAPEVYAWDCRTDSTTIEWVDACWQFPPPAVNPAGTSHTFVTTVTRASNGQPVSGWIVRYEIADGPAAGFKPDSAQVAEAVTNEAGQASVELFQPEAAQGTNQVRIEIIRPENPATGAARAVIASGVTTKTWSAPQVGLRISGPSIAAVGSTATYRLEAVNTGAAASQGVTITANIPPGMALAGSNPQPQAGGVPTWTFGPLAAGAVHSVQFDLQPQQEGSVNVCGTVRSVEGTEASNCVATTVGTAAAPPVTQPPITQPPADNALEVEIVSGPQQARVGDEIELVIRITNRGNVQASGLVIRDAYDAGLSHLSNQNPIERALEDLPPGESTRTGVRLNVNATGRLCQNISVQSRNNLRGAARHCVDVTQATPGRVQVRMSAPPRKNAGESALFDIVIRNVGTETIRKMNVTYGFDTELLAPTEATEGVVKDEARRKLLWESTDLEANQEFKLRVLCKCLKSAPRACSDVSVVADGSAPVRAEACLAITGQPKLTVAINDLNENVQVEGLINYYVRVRNEGTAPAAQVRVQVQFPPENLRFDSVHAENPTRRERVGENTITFEPLESLAVGESLLYRFKLVARQAGLTKVSASASATGLQPVSMEAMTSVLPK